MNNNFLLELIASALPRITLVFVTLVLLYKIYFKIRCKYSKRVNCWFCNQYSKVPYLEANSWTCSKCEQYNGFSKDGGYNREIIQQFDCSSSLIQRQDGADNLNSSFWHCETKQSNGFCDTCNEAQRLKVEKLAQFEPKRESRFDEEFKIYKAELETQYRICGTCDRHLKSVLREKKKMVLGSKFLEYIIKGAEAIKRPTSNRLRRFKEDLWKRRLSLLITVMTLINLCCLFGSLPELSRTWFIEIFGAYFGKKLFIACSHLVACWRALGTLFSGLKQNDLFIRLALFLRTIFMMILYSLGLRLPQLVRINFLSLYLLAAPFCILASTFSYNVIDKFRITRYTLLLILWSLYTGGMIESSVLPIQQVLMFFTSAFTCLLAYTSKTGTSSKLYNEPGNSFRKIYSDDYLSDCETATSSVLSQLDSSSISAHSALSRSFKTKKRSPMASKSPLTSSTFTLNPAPRPSLHAFDNTSPLSSSMLSLNLSTQTEQEKILNSSFKSCFANEHNSTLRPRYGNSVYNFAAPARNPFMNSKTLSNVRSINKSSTSFGNDSFVSLPSMRKTMATSFQHGIGIPTPPAFSPSYVTRENTIHNLERPSRLLSPTRFNFNSTNLVTSNNLTLNGPYQEPKRPSNIMLNSMPLSTNCLSERRNVLGSPCAPNEDLSRASSRSSGFESQNGQLTNSRENSCCRDNNDFCHPSSTSQTDLSKDIQPVDGFLVNGLNSSFTLQKSPFSPFNPCVQPLSVNCSSEWYHRGNPISISDNLRRFNCDFPNFKRGDLLKKWKGGEVLS